VRRLGPCAESSLDKSQGPGRGDDPMKRNELYEQMSYSLIERYGELILGCMIYGIHARPGLFSRVCLSGLSQKF
jgi:hypothetical protein